MQKTSVRETREKLSSLLDAVAAGEEIIILRRGKPAAKLVPATVKEVHFPDRSQLRRELPPAKETSAELVRTLRDEERY
ncbi:type II toxin-antitoxin system prevent-host-death family antitoxin [Pistricoccus aurantiacus]|uniref:Antitoxin n=1 Tax=Pistricoccus aurantiacus TaxID=1883414 RepID=A0A5B8SZ19_9GAMM|nr:type II toxin-antitoxin system prevent-host-death family antitoxin [Pistricoccus aurantiacus]QEA40048.1 type II toxin-antitoxin system prevent-host-death family antitoxin [Pistricoccus aurantiacus]